MPDLGIHLRLEKIRLKAIWGGEIATNANGGDSMGDK